MVCAYDVAACIAHVPCRFYAVGIFYLLGYSVAGCVIAEFYDRTVGLGYFAYFPIDIPFYPVCSYAPGYVSGEIADSGVCIGIR